VKLPTVGVVPSASKVNNIYFSPENCAIDILSTFLPEPDPNPDPYVFGPPVSGSIYHHAKIVRKPLIPSVL
jgi:hypothetical protein